MSKEMQKQLFPMNLQLFADGGGEGADGGGDQGGKKLPPKKEGSPGAAGGSGNEGGDDNDEDDDEGEGGKTYTQEEVNALLAKEKRQGKNAILKKLGLKTVDEGLEKLGGSGNKKEKEDKPADKKEEDSDSKKAVRDAEQRALVAERKAIALMFGATKDNVEDIVLIAGAKVTDEDDFETIVEEISKDKKYASLFGKSEENGGSGGTGSGVGYKKDGKGSVAGSFGKQLAEKKASGKLKDQTKLFFDN